MRSIVLYLFSTSNHNNVGQSNNVAAIVLYLFSTSNHNESVEFLTDDEIVLYLFSTSNHNCRSIPLRARSIVLYLFSTSNHNFLPDAFTTLLLSYISFLHQTTTHRGCKNDICGLSYISFLHQTTTCFALSVVGVNCLISLFYIKPQHIFNNLFILRYLYVLVCV